MNRETRVSLCALQTALALFFLLAMFVVPSARADYQVGPLFPPHAGYDYAPSMIREGNFDKFWWCGDDVPGGPDSTFKDVIYYRSVDRTTMTWSPILKVLTPSASGWDSIHVCDPAVVRGTFSINGQNYSYAMYYTGLQDADGTDNRIGVAFSNDGINWTKYAGNPVISPQVEPSLTYGAGQPAVFNANGASTLYVFYTDISTVHDHRSWVKVTSDGINFSTPTLLSNVSNFGQVAVNGDYGYDAQTDTFYGLFGDRARLNGPGNADNDKEAFALSIYSIPGSQLLAGQGTWSFLGTIDTNLTGSYLNHTPGILRDGFGNVTPWLPAIGVYFTRGNNSFNSWDLSWVIWDNQPNTLALSRWYSPSVNEIWDVTGYVGPGYSFYGTLGYVYMAPQSNTHAMYACSISNEHFASLDPNCEGQFPLGLFGFLHTSQPSGIPTAPLFRCRAIYDHFLSTASNCEGWTMEGLMGYIRTQP